MGLLNIIMSIFTFFLMVAWIWTVMSVVTDIFRSKDLNGWSKGLWMLFVILTPWLGVLAYLVIRGDSMHERSAEVALQFAENQRSYLQNAIGVSTADELTKLVALKEKGVITEAQYEAQKARLL